MEIILFLKAKVPLLLAFFKQWGDLLFAGLSLVLSIIALVQASKAQKLQNQVNKLELIIKEYEVEQISKDKESSSLARIEARIVHMGKNSYRMKVWNSGNVPAYNVSARFEGNPGIIIANQGKQPFDELAPKKNYELIVIPHGSSASKFKIITEWKDAEGNPQSYSQMGDI